MQTDRGQPPAGLPRRQVPVGMREVAKIASPFRASVALWEAGLYAFVSPALILLRNRVECHPPKGGLGGMGWGL